MKEQTTKIADHTTRNYLIASSSVLLIFILFAGYVTFTYTSPSNTTTTTNTTSSTTTTTNPHSATIYNLNVSVTTFCNQSLSLAPCRVFALDIQLSNDSIIRWCNNASFLTMSADDLISNMSAFAINGDGSFNFDIYPAGSDINGTNKNITIAAGISITALLYYWVCFQPSYSPPQVECNTNHFIPFVDNPSYGATYIGLLVVFQNYALLNLSSDGISWNSNGIMYN